MAFIPRDNRITATYVANRCPESSLIQRTLLEAPGHDGQPWTVLEQQSRSRLVEVAELRRASRLVSSECRFPSSVPDTTEVCMPYKLCSLNDTLHRYIQTSYSYSQVNCPCALQSTLLATLGRLYEFVLLALASPCLSVSRFHSRPSTVSLT